MLVVAVACLAAAVVLWRSAALAAASVAPLVALAYSVLSEARARPRLRARHVLGGRRFVAGDRAPAALEIENEGGSTGLAEVRVVLPDGTELASGSSSMLLRLPRGRRARTEYALDLPVRGRRDLGPVRVTFRGPFGLTEREATLEGSAPFDILPSWEPLRSLPLPPRSRSIQAGSFAAGRAGSGSEFLGLRAYLPGDPMDAVNWKQTAKRGRPIVNERELEAPAHFVLVLDARDGANVGVGRHATLEAGVRATVSIAERAVRERYKVGLVLLGRRLSWVHPAAGRRQHEKIVERLLEIEEGGNYRMAEAIASAPPHVIPKGARVVIVTPGHVDATLRGAVLALRARGVAVLALLPGPERAEIASGVGGELGPIAARVLLHERRRFVESVRQAGADVVDWDPAEPLGLALAGLAGRGGGFR